MAEQTCKTCDGKGLITCEGCRGASGVNEKGVDSWASCARCRGKGTVTCSKCRGSGKS